MKLEILKPTSLVATFGLAALLAAGAVFANGPIGDHVNNLQAHLDEYAEEVVWLNEQIEDIVSSYERGGLANTEPERVVEIWEEVNFHGAIETNYVPVYASIWQGLFGVRQAIEGEQPIATVRAQQMNLEQALWQGLGAVKLAAQFQARGLVANIEDTVATSPVETLTQVGQLLDRVVAKYAERLPEEALSIVYDTYLTRFEGVEGELIEQDADLVEDLEVDFNVTLPQALENNASVDQVRGIVDAMKTKLNRARTMLEEADANRPSVF